MGTESKCSDGNHCVALGNLRTDLREEVAKRQGAFELLDAGIKHLAREIVAVPLRVTDAIKRERDEVGTRMKRGESHFDEIFRRLNTIESNQRVLWILVVLVGLADVGKIVMLLIPLVKGLF